MSETQTTTEGSGESFAELYENSLKSLKEGEVVHGKVLSVDSDFVQIDIGYKSEGQLNTSEFLDENQEINVGIGDVVEVFLEAVEDADGIVVLSKDILTVPDDEILDARVDLTILGGEVRYKRN